MIVCRVCSQPVQRVLYGAGGHRFSTVTCYKCQKGIEAGKTPDELIYEAIVEERKQADAAADDIGPAMFKASGIRRKVTEAVQEIKKRIATRRRRITED